MTVPTGVPRAGRAPRAGPAPGVIPNACTDLVQHPRVAALTTVARDGSPQTSVVWCDLDGGMVRVNTMRGFAKERNMRRRPQVAILGYDPRRPLRYLEVRGTVVGLDEDGAREHLDAIASAYVGRPVHYFGDVAPEHYAQTERPVLCRIRPRHVVAVDEEPSAATRPAGPRPAPPVQPAARPPARQAVPPDAGGPVPRSHLDLLHRGICGVFTTMDRRGRPQSSLVWLDADGECARVNTTLERQKGRNLLADPRASLLVVDPDDTSRYVQIRGVVELVRDGALEHLDALTRTYTDSPPSTATCTPPPGPRRRPGSSAGCTPAASPATRSTPVPDRDLRPRPGTFGPAPGPSEREIVDASRSGATTRHREGTQRMPSINDAAADFLSHKRVAVTGVSRTPASHGSNAVYQRLRARGYDVYAVNPNASEVEGDPAYPNLGAIPGGVEAVVIGTRPDHALATLEECAGLGIKQVWMHRGPGAGSVSEEATQWGRGHGMTVIDGGCPLMFDPTADAGHKMMRWVFGLTGNVPRRV
ncbi:TIGR03618 family F420-dependent PPOX class oxidoreductase [Intrasporangium flavum]|uniref:TIGR03618 family F420-dependent PPOX class oxidoreductase n=1 Tax=Intrasporangium flavum TaxID=1428657 RepID=UPI0009F9DFCE|nr:TIGR03618 family F420-dependent PPOX class oxidoreductase [Intrasporangium flavum]